MKRKPFLIIFGFLIVSLLMSCSPQQNDKTEDTEKAAEARQKTVEAVSLLPEGHIDPSSNVSNLPLDSVRLEGWFDANDYFTVLNHLSMQPGYVLDYVYNSNGSGGQPYLYARKVDSKPFNTLDELRKTYVDQNVDHKFDYLAFVKADGTEESFFQFVVLRIMGGQFYLWWHAGYNDRTIICTREKLEAVAADSNLSIGPKLPSEDLDKARKLDFAPRVSLGKNSATVRVVFFTKWGGFIEETYSIAREFPHTFQNVDSKALVPWDSGLRF